MSSTARLVLHSSTCTAGSAKRSAEAALWLSSLLCRACCAVQQVYKGGLSRTGTEDGEQFRYFSQQVGGRVV